MSGAGILHSLDLCDRQVMPSYPTMLPCSDLLHPLPVPLPFLLPVFGLFCFSAQGIEAGSSLYSRPLLHDSVGDTPSPSQPISYSFAFCQSDITLIVSQKSLLTLVKTIVNHLRVWLPYSCALPFLCRKCHEKSYYVCLTCTITFVSDLMGGIQLTC